MGKVLVVDDDANTRLCLRLVLEDGGYEVLEANDGQAAYTLLQWLPEPVVVLFDKAMPRLDGAGLLDLVASDTRISDRHAFICITASANRIPPHLTTLLALFEAPLVAKPFDIDELLDVVREAEKRLERQPALASVLRWAV